MIKSTLVILAGLILVFTMAPPAFALDNTPTVILDSRILSFDVPPLMPVRAIFEAMGAPMPGSFLIHGSNLCSS